MRTPPRPADARNYVLCPGLAYDRSPCGTGTSAKLACLAADGKLAPGDIWRQESIIGSRFEASYRAGSDGRMMRELLARHTSRLMRSGCSIPPTRLSGAYARSRTYDLIIAGAGIVGAACADRATSEGLRVAVIEPGVVGGGATGAGMGHLVALDDNEFEFALAMRSLALWEEMREVAEAEFQRCGTLWLAENEREYAELRSKLGRLGSLGRRAELLPTRTCCGSSNRPWHRTVAVARMIDDAVIYPPGITRWMLRRARSRGAAIYENRRVISWIESGGARLTMARTSLVQCSSRAAALASTCCRNCRYARARAT